MKSAWHTFVSLPVHRISENYKLQNLWKPSSHDVPQIDDKVGYLELNPITAGLLNAVEENVAAKRRATSRLRYEYRLPRTDAFIAQSRSARRNAQLEILTGTRADAHSRRPKMKK